MKHISCLSLATLLAACASAYGQTTQPGSKYPTMAPLEKYLMAPADEIALARSSGPPSISGHASVLVLGKQGYYVAVKGDNGWVCLVERSWTAGLDDPEFWNPKGRGPSCFNRPAVLSVLPQYVERTKWALAGDTREEIAKKAQAAYASHHFADPASASFAFMLSKGGYLNDEVAGPWLPHVMPFIAYNQLAIWAAGQKGSPILAGPHMRPYEPMTIFIPVRRWSDGSPGPPVPVLH
jgi:hypothetical protein